MPASRTIALRRTSKTMRTAIDKADAGVQVRAGIPIPSAVFLQRYAKNRATVPRRTRACQRLPLGEDRSRQAGGGHRASFLSASLVEAHLQWNDIHEGGGRVLAETLRAAQSPCTTCSSRSTCPGLNTTLTSLNLNRNCLGEGTGRALAETLRQTSLSLSYRQLRPSVICLIVNKLLSLSLSLSLSPSMLEPVRPEAVSPDRALCLPTLSHFSIVNKLLCLSLCRSHTPS